MKKLTFILSALVFAAFPLLMSAQDSGGPITATGCIKQGNDAKGYYLMSQDGKMYELWGKNLGEHLNHTVTVTGMQAKLSPAMEEKKEASEKAEAGSASYVDLKVTNLKMVSESCK